jgi:hypothetical protein
VARNIKFRILTLMMTRTHTYLLTSILRSAFDKVEIPSRGRGLIECIICP